MSTRDEQIPGIEERAPATDVSGNYQPIHLEDTVGAILLGIVAVIALIGWVRAEARWRASLSQAGTTTDG